MKDQNPLISIALATYNGEKYLKEMLDSIKSQTYKNIEIIACDDQSEDDTIKILHEYSQKINLRYFINERRLGVVKNFEKALTLCKGKFIALADQDDIWLPEKIDTLFNEIKKEENLFCVISDAEVINEEGKVISNSFVDYIGVNKSTDFLDFLFGSKYIGCAFLIRKELLDYALPFPDNICCHDWWINIIASKKGKVKFIYKKLMYYRLHGSNTTGAVKSSFSSLLKFYLSKGRKFMEEHQEILYATLKKLKDCLTPQEKRIIRDLIKYNKRKDKYFSFSSFIIFLKYFNKFASGKSLHLKLAYMLSTIIGFKAIEILNTIEEFFYEKIQ